MCTSPAVSTHTHLFLSCFFLSFFFHPTSEMGNVVLVHFVVGIFGNAFALFLFLAPLITFKRIVKKRSTEQFSGVPYAMTLLNCLLSAWYGMPFVSPNNLLVSTINGAGAVIESVYVMVFIIFASNKEKTKIVGLFILVVSVFGVVVSLFALHGNARKLFCGVAATVFSIIMYGSPLTIIRLVMKTKSVEFMPFFLSLFVFLCGTSWFLFGLLGKDPFVAIPNGFGCGLGVVQLILYAMYRKNKGDDTKLEMQMQMQKQKGKLDHDQKQSDGASVG